MLVASLGFAVAATAAVAQELPPQNLCIGRTVGRRFVLGVYV